MKAKAIRTLDDFHKFVMGIIFYPNIGNNLSYPSLGLSEEAGEVSGKIKKIIRDKGGRLGKSDRKEIMKELGDVLSYISMQANELGSTLEDVANIYQKKILARKKRGTLKGSGDNR